MTINLIKLCVGAETLDDLIRWRLELLSLRRDDPSIRSEHITRSTPKRKDELLSGGSLYWVIKGQIQARQTLDDIITFTDSDGISRCKLVFGDDVIPTHWRSRRAFQGWRYLESSDAPPDLPKGEASIDPSLYLELSELGLL